MFLQEHFVDSNEAKCSRRNISHEDDPLAGMLSGTPSESAPVLGRLMGTRPVGRS